MAHAGVRAGNVRFRFLTVRGVEYMLLVLPMGREEAMSKALSLKLNDDVFRETEEILRRTRRPRNAYINNAVSFYNKLWKRRVLKKALAEESALVREDSLEVLDAFEKFEEEAAR